MCQRVLIETQFLPPICSFRHFVRSEGVIFEMQENYQKRSYRNRCKLVGPNGIQTLSIPLCKGKNQQKSIRDVEISYDMPWVSNHLNTIRSCYSNAPYFDFIYEGIEQVLLSKPKFLRDVNIMIIFNIINFLGLDLAIASSTIFERNATNDTLDLRNRYLPVNSSSNNRFNFEPYQQVFIEKNGFISNLSVLDLLFCLGKETVPYFKRSLKNDHVEFSESKLKSET